MVYSVIFKIVYDKMQWNSKTIGTRILKIIGYEYSTIVMRDIYKLN